MAHPSVVGGLMLYLVGRGAGSVGRTACWESADRCASTCGGTHPAHDVLPPARPKMRATSRPAGTGSWSECCGWHSAAMACWSSVLSLARRTRGSSSRAACAKALAPSGRQGTTPRGPEVHQHRDVAARHMLCRAGRIQLQRRPANRGRWHWPQSGALPRSALCTRLVVWQWGQTMCRASVMGQQSG